jgi:hypothetical protein
MLGGFLSGEHAAADQALPHTTDDSKNFACSFEIIALH